MTRHQWLLTVAIAAGLVGMHHLVHSPTAHPMSMTSATHIGHSDPDPAGVDSVEMISASTPVVASRVDCCDPVHKMGHFCMAVLTTITALCAALLVAAAWRRPLEQGGLLAAASAVAARAPPAGSVRLTQLCVLRS
ncbi:MAG: DUF6153 family protein [Pseudonocardiaceae bacterium]